MSFFSDLKVALKELPKLIYILSTNTPHRPLYEDTSIVDFRLIYRFFMGQKYPSENYIGQTPISYHNVENIDGEKWMFVNGICTDTSGLKNNCLELSRLFGKSIYPVHNITEGVLKDLIECVIGRTFNKIQDVSSISYLAVLSALKENEKVVLIGHSQGGIVCSNVVRLLHKFNPELVDKLEVYTFASAHDEFVHHTAEHFANELDYVARIGAITHSPKCCGELYLKKGMKGHLLNKHYLCNFRQKVYCNGESKLFSYIK